MPKCVDCGKDCDDVTYGFDPRCDLRDEEYWEWYADNQYN